MGLRLDKTDVAIVDLLQKDSRMMYKEIALRLNVNLPTVRARIRKLMGLGVIKKFTVVVDAEKIYGRIGAILTINGKASDLELIARRLAEMDEVREVHMATGASEIVAKIETDSMTAMEGLTMKKLPQIPEIMGVRSSIIMKTFKEEPSKLYPEAIVQLKCAFCGAPIADEPYVEEIEGMKMFFSARACADAFKQGLRRTPSHKE